MNPKIKFLSSINNKPVQPSYLPLESFLDYKESCLADKKLNPPQRAESTMSGKKSPAEIAAEKAAGPGDGDRKNAVKKGMSFLNPDRKQEEFIYRPGGTELSEAINEGLNK